MTARGNAGLVTQGIAGEAKDGIAGEAKGGIAGEAKDGMAGEAKDGMAGRDADATDGVTARVLAGLIPETTMFAPCIAPSTTPILRALIMEDPSARCIAVRVLRCGDPRNQALQNRETPAETQDHRSGRQSMRCVR